MAYLTTKLTRCTSTNVGSITIAMKHVHGKYKLQMVELLRVSIIVGDVPEAVVSVVTVNSSVEYALTLELTGDATPLVLEC